MKQFAKKICRIVVFDLGIKSLEMYIASNFLYVRKYFSQTNRRNSDRYS